MHVSAMLTNGEIMNAALWDVKPRTVPVLFVVDGSFGEICKEGRKCFI